MNNYETIEKHYAKIYNTNTTSRKDIGDIYVNGVPINIKSSHIDGDNFSPNMMSADKLYNYLINPNNNLKFMFVKYDDNDILDEQTVNVEHISWDCLKIRCQGKGVIQLSKSLKVDRTQTKKQFIEGLCKAYEVYINKERKKLNLLEEKYCQ